MSTIAGPVTRFRLNTIANNGVPGPQGIAGPAGTNGINGAGATPIFVSNLSTTRPSAIRQYQAVDGYAAVGDGGGGIWVWNSVDVRTADGATIIAVTGITTGRWNLSNVNGMDVRWFGADGTGVNDSTAAIHAAHDAFGSLGGEIILPDNCTFKITNLVFTKPIKMRMGRTVLQQASGSSGAMLTTTANLRIEGHDQNESTWNIASGCTGIIMASPWVNGGIGQYYGPAFVITDVAFAGGLSSISSSGLTGFYEGNLHLERCLFHDTTGLAIDIEDSVYYGFITRCHFYHCYQGISIGTATETKLMHNVYVQADAGSNSLILHGIAHVTVRDEEFYGWFGVTAPDILLYAENDSADGVGDITNCKFGAELELSFTTARNRIQVNAPGGTAVATLGTKITNNRFYGPGGMAVTAYSWTGGHSTATITPNNGTDHGIQVGDLFSILGDPVVAHSGYQGGPWTCTSRTATTVTWAHSGSLSNYSGVSALVLPGSVSAIAILTPLSRFDYSGNYFQGYNFAEDDTAIITENTRDSGGRSTFDQTNRMIGPLGMACQEFKLGGRQMAVMKAGPCSPLISFDADARINETPGARNRIEVDSEDFTQWGNVGSITITASETDPWGTSRATLLGRAGATQIFTGTWPAQGLGEALTAAVNVSGVISRGFVSFWAKAGTSNSMSVSLFNDGNGNVMLCDQVTLGTNWKRYRLPFVYDASLGAVSLNISPGGFDACLSTCYVCGFQVDDYGGDYVPVHGSADSSFVDTKLGNRYERDLEMAGTLRLAPNGDGAPTIAQSGTGLGTAATFTTIATRAGMVVKCNTGTSPSSAGLVTVAFAYTLPGVPLVLIQLEDGAGGYWPNGSVCKILSKTASGFTIDWNCNGTDLPNASTSDAVRFNILFLPMVAN